MQAVMASARKNPSRRHSRKHNTQKAARAASSEDRGVPREELLCRLARRARELYQQHGKLDLPPEWETDWHERAFSLLREFLKTGDLAQLEKLLRNLPIALWHPIVQSQMLHLDKLARMPTEEEAAEEYQQCGEMPAKDEVIADDLKRQTLTALSKLLEAWLPGHSVTISTRRHAKGRPAEWLDTLYDNTSLAEDYEEFEAIAETYPSAELKRKTTETGDAFAHRTADFVQYLHSRHMPQILFGAYDRFNAGTWERKPLPAEIAQEISIFACQEKIVSIPVLLHHLLAHYFDSTPDAIRGRIQRYNKTSTRED